jgi:hypothetical protein
VAVLIFLGPSQLRLSVTLTKEEAERKLCEGSASVISEALKLEEQQCVTLFLSSKTADHWFRASLRQYAHNITPKSSVLEVKKLEDRRHLMRTRIRSYIRRLVTIGMNRTVGLAGTGLSTTTADTTQQLTEELLEEVRQWHEEVLSENDFEELDMLSDDEDIEPPLAIESLTSTEDHDEALAIPEKFTIWMPSYDEDAPANFHDLELELRQAQASDALHMVKVKIGEKSVLIRHVVRRNRDAGQYRKGRAWKEVSASHTDLVRAWRTYERARMAIMRLPGHEKLGQKFQSIAREDLKEIKDITHANRVGQKNYTLPWFWQMQGNGSSEEDWQIEGKIIILSRCR